MAASSRSSAVVSLRDKSSCVSRGPACGWSRAPRSSCCRLLRSHFPSGVRRALEAPAETHGPCALHEALSPEAAETAQAAMVARFLEALRLDPSEPHRTVHARLLRQAHPDKHGESACRHCTEELLDMRCAVGQLRCAGAQAEGRAVTDLVVMGGLLLAAGAVTQWLGGGGPCAVRQPRPRPQRRRRDGGGRARLSSASLAT